MARAASLAADWAPLPATRTDTGWPMRDAAAMVLRVPGLRTLLLWSATTSVWARRAGVRATVRVPRAGATALRDASMGGGRARVRQLSGVHPVTLTARRISLRSVDSDITWRTNAYSVAHSVCCPRADIVSPWMRPCRRVSSSRKAQRRYAASVSLLLALIA